MRKKEDLACYNFYSTQDGRVCSRPVIDTLSEISEPSSKFGLVYCIHFRINTHDKDLNLSSLILLVMSEKLM